MDENGEKGREGIWREKEFPVWIANWEGTNLKGRKLEGFYGYFSLWFHFLQS